MKSGQSLIEVLIAIAITVLLGVALVSTAVFTQKASIAAKNTAFATKAVQEMIEELRIFRDQSRGGIGAFPGLAGDSNCYSIPSTSVKNADGSLNLTPDVSTGNLKWTFTSIGSTCPMPPTGLGYEILYPFGTSIFPFYRAVQITKNATDGSVTCVVTVSWQEQSGWRSISDNLYLGKW